MRGSPCGSWVDALTGDTIWADASKLSIKSIGTNAAPQLPPIGARPDLPSYRHVTDERPWRPSEARPR